MSEELNMNEKFAVFHEANPQVYDLFSRFTQQAIDAGMKKMGVAFIFERMRWESMVVTKGDPYKLNNNYKSYYSRMFESKNPQYEGLFTKRIALVDCEEFLT